ncbi:MAG: cytochrome b/b6 domain-containing protein [Bosea sp. (in: a-proteobacteria)]|nr:cytochrome b/b6 domain-containing protein [Bosea sp. (in: a-proteobacteria)]
MRSKPRPSVLARPGTQAFNVYQRAMHWTVPVLCIAQVPTAWAIQRTHMAHGFLKPAPIDLFLHQVHAWSGWLILLMALLQLAIRLVCGRPHPLDGTSRLEARVAAATHMALYGLLIALPVTGTIAMYLTFRVAPLHRLLSWLLLALVVIHVFAALWHHLYRRDDVLRRMIKG